MNIEYTYHPTDLEDEVFLSEVPIEIIKESITTQFNEPFEYRKKDYVRSFISRYNFSKENLFDDDLTLTEIYRDEFLKFMENTFENYLCIGFPDLEDKDEDTQDDLIHLTYRFFIKNIKKNFINLFSNFINDKRNETSSFCEKRKDITATNFKSEIDDDYDIQVLANLDNIIEGITAEVKNYTVDDFFKLCTGDELSLELEFVENAYFEFNITGNFIEKYFEMINDDFLVEIQSKLRNRILKKYPKRTRQIIIDEESNINEESEDESELDQ